jgi:hypothetical protein
MSWRLPDKDTEPLDTFEAALDAIIFRTLALTSAIAKLDYWDGARLRGDVERALGRAHELVVELPNTRQWADTLSQLRRMREVAELMLAIAPSPSTTALATAELGDMTLWRREEQAWIERRQNSAPHAPVPRRRHRDTRPDTPTALCDAAASILALARDPSCEKADKR